MTHIAGGARWRSEIENALRNSQYVIVVLSPDSIVSEWVEREFLFFSNLRRKIIPIMHRACEVPLNYVDLNYIDVQGENYSKNFNGLLRSLNVGPALSALPAPNPENRFGKWKPPVLAVIGGVILTAVLLGSRLMKGLFAPTPALPTQSAGVFSSPATEFLSHPPGSSDYVDPRGILMQLVPAGQFTMGVDAVDALAVCQLYRSDCQLLWFTDEQPPHPVELDAFYIDTYEVTNAAYKACADAGVCDSPKRLNSSTRPDYYGNPEFDNYPVIHVGWDMARTYCVTWRGGVLPTEAQWEKAARGTDDRTYPWGAGIGETLANYNYQVGDTTEVGNYPDGKSPYGLYDMAGNVWEWGADWYGDSYYQDSLMTNPTGPNHGEYRTLRGGSWSDSGDFLRVSLRGRDDPTVIVDNGFGFRCARKLNP